MTLYHLVARPPEDFDRPVLVVALDGWIDAGLGGAGAVEHLVSSVPTELVARFDADALIDHRARRPTLRVENGMNTGLTWPEIELRSGVDRTGNAILVLRGPEPDFRWHGFVDAVAELAHDFGVRLLCGLGAFPAPVPHTRPVRLASTATSSRLAEEVGFVPGLIDVPAGIAAALEERFAAAGIDAVGIWARVPHYVAAMPYPAASAALIEGLAAVAGLTLDARALHDAATAAAARIDQLIADSGEHVAMVRQLEATLDQAEAEAEAEAQAEAAFDLSEIPSGDEIAAELERFLRGES